jgi:predicted ATPase
MITKWVLSNFKSVRNTAELGFAPITLFVGQNSAGKSTVLQSILLTAQTIQSNSRAKAVVLNGRITRLGSFADVHSNAATGSEVRIGFTLARSPFEQKATASQRRPSYPSYYAQDREEKMREVEVSYSFSGGSGSELAKEYQLQPRLEGAILRFAGSDVQQDARFEFQRHEEPAEAVLQRLGVDPENYKLSDTSALEYQVMKSAGTNQPNYRRAYRLPKQSNPAGVLLRHFLPAGACVAYDAVAEEVETAFEIISDTYSSYRYGTIDQEWLRSTSKNDTFRQLILDAFRAAQEKNTEFGKSRAQPAIDALSTEFSVERLAKAQSSLTASARKALAINLAEKEEEIKSLLRGGRAARREVAAIPLQEQLRFAADYVTSFFTDEIRYLGPLRDEPKAIYPMTGYNDPKDVGFRGEYTAAVLENHKHEKVRYLPSDRFPFSIRSKNELLQTTLGEAVTDWLRHLGIANEVATEDKGKLGHELTISTGGSQQLHDLTHVGVGVSQALPIVVSSLLAPSGATLIFEQPELHLNPRVQTRLADFIVSLMLSGKQCVIETHSEYLISRLRYLAAMSEDVAIAQNIMIYFVEKPGGESIYRQVIISDTGSIRNWPSGFFDETEKNSEAIIRAQLQKSRLRSKRGAEGGKQ